MLLANDSKVNDTDNEGWIRLMRAAWEGNTNVLQVLMENKANIHYKKHDGYTALHLAAHHDKAGPARMLLAANESIVNDTDNDRWTQLMRAAWEGNTNILQVLINTMQISLQETRWLHCATSSSTS